jgi:hypothetical protein
MAEGLAFLEGVKAIIPLATSQAIVDVIMKMWSMN